MLLSPSGRHHRPRVPTALTRTADWNVGAFDLNSGFFAAIDAVIIFCGMTTVTLTPEQDRFATEAVAQGRFRDVNEVVKASLDLLRDAETERVAFLASLKEAEAESEQHGFLVADDVHREMVALIEGIGRPQQP